MDGKLDSKWLVKVGGKYYIRFDAEDYVEAEYVYNLVYVLVKLKLI